MAIKDNSPPVERLGNRLGYMGTAFIMMSPYLLKYDNLGENTLPDHAVLSLPEKIWIAKQWNLVIVKSKSSCGGMDFLYLDYDNNL